MNYQVKKTEKMMQFHFSGNIFLVLKLGRDGDFYNWQREIMKTCFHLAQANQLYDFAYNRFAH